eukprot:SAG22_NODE_1822_length_3511_cov_5.060082_3_plen_43_part_00
MLMVGGQPMKLSDITPADENRMSREEYEKYSEEMDSSSDSES